MGACEIIFASELTLDVRAAILTSAASTDITTPVLNHISILIAVTAVVVAKRDNAAGSLRLD